MRGGDMVKYASCKQCQHCKDYKQYQGFWLAWCKLENGHIVDDEKIKCDDFKQGEISK